MSTAVVLAGFPTRRPGLPTLASLLLFGSLLGGCALDPYVDLPVPSTKPVTVKEDGAEKTVPAEVDYAAFPALEAARDRTVGVLTDTKDHRQEFSTASVILNILTFGAAAAGGVAAVYGASPGLVLGLGLTATGAYTANNVFVGKNRILLYLSGIRVLHCVVSTADRVPATDRMITVLLDAENEYEKLAAEVAALHTQFDWTTTEGDRTIAQAAGQALASYEAAKFNQQIFKRQDQAFGLVLDQATLLFADTLNKRLAELQPSPEEIFKLASAIGVGAVAYVKQVTPPPPEKEKVDKAMEAMRITADDRADGTKGPPDEIKRALLRTRAATLQAGADDVNDRISKATNDVSDVGKTCILEEPPTPPLKFTGSADVTIPKDKISTLVFTGGRTPLKPSWKDGKAPAIEMSVVDRTVVLYPKGAPEAGPFTLIVKDDQPAASSVEVKITVK